ncbi:MAG: alpha/beta hydrolase [DPANN group archaeon]|nr:alpha/beta hydrolase [DPANN group archaeon]
MVTRTVLVPDLEPLDTERLFNAFEKVLGNTAWLNEVSSEVLWNIHLRFNLDETMDEYILIGKSLGAKVVLEGQLRKEDVHCGFSDGRRFYLGAQALVLLTPDIEPDNKFRKISVPVLIINGTLDETLPRGDKDVIQAIVKNSRALQKIIPKCQLVEIKDNSFSFAGREEEVARIVKDWLAKEEQNFPGLLLPPDKVKL